MGWRAMQVGVHRTTITDRSTPSLRGGEMSKAQQAHGGITRRGFLKTTGALAGAAAVGGAAAGLSSLEPKGKAFAEESSEEKVVTTICRSNCFQACLLNAHVRDGKLRRTSRADYDEDIYSGCCVKGLSLAERVYSRTRVKYPMRRVGERGADQWERISWDDAINQIVDSITATRDKYGMKAVAYDYGSGNYASVQGGAGVWMRFSNVLEMTSTTTCYDQAFGYGASRVVGGGVWGYSNETRTMLDSKYILIWGANPVNSQPQTWRIIRAAQERGAKVIDIDPMYSLTAARADEHIVCAPGTDLYVAMAMINEIVNNDRIDEAYVKGFTNAPFLIRKDTGMILRQSDVESKGEATHDPATLVKPGSMATDPAIVWDASANEPAPYITCTTPALEGEYTVAGIEVQTVYTALKAHVAEYSIEEASRLSLIPEDKIHELVDIYASGDEVFLYSIYGIDHYLNGHLWAQAMSIIAALTNNISRKGTGVGGYGAALGGISFPMTHMNLAYLFPTGKMAASIPTSEFATVLSTGKFMGKDYPVKMLMIASSNPMTNWAQQTKWIDEVVPNLDFIVTMDMEMTDTARYSDLVLPVCSWFETDDIRPNFSNPYVAYGNQAIDPLYECKRDTDIAAILAERLGVGDFVPHKEPSEWIDELLDSDALRAMGITQEAVKEKGAVRFWGSAEEPYIIGYNGKPLPTPSGRAEIYCELPLPRKDYGQDWKEASAKERFPYFLAPEESYPEAESASVYPFYYLQSHERWRTHSQWFSIETLRELDPEPRIYLSRKDAEERGIQNEDVVEIFNDRGHLVAKATINDSCCPGLLYSPKGWQRNQCIEGSFQELTNGYVNPMAVNFAYYDVRVDIRKK